MAPYWRENRFVETLKKIRAIKERAHDLKNQDAS
jgi:hypothetical protein